MPLVSSHMRSMCRRSSGNGGWPAGRSGAMTGPPPSYSWTRALKIACPAERSRALAHHIAPARDHLARARRRTTARFFRGADHGGRIRCSRGGSRCAVAGHSQHFPRTIAPSANPEHTGNHGLDARYDFSLDYSASEFLAIVPHELAWTGHEIAVEAIFHSHRDQADSTNLRSAACAAAVAWRSVWWFHRVSHAAPSPHTPLPTAPRQ
jgi:hypothetical protein